jgi:hypothetical protein
LGHLPISTNHPMFATPYTQNGGSTKLIHNNSR